MKNAPCARFGIRIRPKISEKPDDNRNSRPPKATLFSVWMIQNCHCMSGFSVMAPSFAPPSSPGLTRQSIFLRKNGPPGQGPGVTPDEPADVQQLLLQVLRRRIV